jgi:D-alanyl-D-alanine carboxypeptidase
VSPEGVDRADLALARLEYRGDDFRGLGKTSFTTRGRDGVLHEVELAHLGGTPESRAGAYLVSAVGTGTQVQLSSWRITDNAPVPAALQNAEPFVGRDVALQVLTPASDPEATRRPLLVSRIGPDNNLWLTGYEVSGAGAFTEHNSVGYGSNANVKVLAHAVVHVPADNGDAYTQVITPMVVENAGGTREMRVVTWRVNNATHEVQGVKDSGPLDVLSLRADGGDLSIHRSFAGIFEINYKASTGKFATRYIGVAENGTVLDAGGGQSGKTYQGSNQDVYIDEAATARLNNHAFVAITQTADKTEMSVWERRVAGCFLVFCSFDPYELGTSDNDLRPHQPGVTVPLPALTNAYGTTPGTNEFFGTSVVAGDFNGDGFQDLAVGAPGQRVDGNADAGAVTILYGSPSGPYASNLNQFIHQDSPGIQGKAEAGDRFGQTLAVGDFNGDGHDDLAIGVPGEDIEADGLVDVGVVQILYGGSNGLKSTGDQLFRQGNGGVEGLSESGDQFASALAVGDFNGDGRDDLAVGIPYEDHNGPGYDDGGAVHIFYGSGSGLRTDNDVTFHLDSAGMLGDAASGDEYGYALAAGDLNQDGRDDLAIGIPGKRFFGMNDAGAVHVVMGSANGLGTQDFLISQDGIIGNNGNSLGDISEGTETDDRFGAALAIGDFNGDGFGDLAIGATGEDHNGFNSAGLLHILRGSASGPSTAGEQIFHQETVGVPSEAHNGSRFATSLAAGDVDGDGRDDLLIGIPRQDEKISNFITYANAGNAVLLRGSANGLSTLSSKLLKQDSAGIGGEIEPSDNFGHAVHLADMNNDGLADAIIGVPNDTVNKLSSEYNNAGTVQLIFGHGSDVFSSKTATWVQGETKQIRAKLANSAWEAQYGVGNGELYESMPPGAILPEHAASVTKTMTLLLAAEALDMPNSPIALTDVVTISKKAGETGGSKMTGTQGDEEDVNIAEGDQLTLETLLYGMMIPSGNRASVAIAEHIAMNVYGASNADLDEPFEVFVDRMNDRAELIGLDDTRYGHPAGGSTTTPQDLITFWREAWKNITFRTYAGARAGHPSNPATTLNLDPQKEFVLQRNSDYVGHDGYKGGHGKVGEVYDKQGNVVPAPICDQCHVGSATRAGHSLIVGIQQSEEDVTNAERLYDFGFRQLFTPDRRGTNDYQDNGPIIINPGQVVMGDLRAISLDHVTGNWVVSAAIDSNSHLQLQSWNAGVGSGNIASMGGVTVAVDHLAPAPANVNPDRVLEVVQMPSGGKILGDYVTGMIAEGNLRLDAWRVGAEYVAPTPFVPPPVATGDFTGDGQVDVHDIELLGDQFGSPRPNLAFDLNGDRRIDRDDLDILVLDVLDVPYGDANLDGLFNSTDLIKMFQAGKYENPRASNATWGEGDFNQDGFFTSDDIILAFRGGAYTTAGAVAASRDARLLERPTAEDKSLLELGTDEQVQQQIRTEAVRLTSATSRWTKHVSLAAAVDVLFDGTGEAEDDVFTPSRRFAWDLDAELFV